MRLTRAGEYAVRCILYLASRGEGVVSRRKELAEAMDIPEQFLSKIAQQLARAGMIEIVQGWPFHRINSVYWMSSRP